MSLSINPARNCAPGETEIGAGDDVIVISEDGRRVEWSGVLVDVAGREALISVAGGARGNANWVRAEWDRVAHPDSPEGLRVVVPGDFQPGQPVKVTAPASILNGAVAIVVGPGTMFSKDQVRVEAGDHDVNVSVNGLEAFTTMNPDELMEGWRYRIHDRKHTDRLYSEGVYAGRGPSNFDGTDSVRFRDGHSAGMKLSKFAFPATEIVEYVAVEIVE